MDAGMMRYSYPSAQQGPAHQCFSYKTAKTILVHHHLFAQSTSNIHVQQCNIVEQDSKVQERTLTAARKRSMT